MPQPLFLEIKALEKKYSQGFHLTKQDHTWDLGEVVGIIGANGAGKSTLFQMLTGHLEASHGSVFLGGQKLTPEACELKKSIGYLPQHLQLPPWVSGQDLISYAATLYEFHNIKETVKESMEFWDCLSYANRPLTSCSHGMQKRIGLSLATIHSPPLLILDEPFSGLDLFHIRNLINTIKLRVQNKQLTILSSHITPYVAELCSRVITIKEGKTLELKEWTSADQIGKVKLIESQFF